MESEKLSWRSMSPSRMPIPTYLTQKRNVRLLVSFVVASVLLYVLFAASSVRDRVRYHLTGSSQKQLAADVTIPDKIWQIYIAPPKLPKESPVPEYLGKWIMMNPTCNYQFVNSKAADAFVTSHFSHRSDIVAAFTQIKIPVLQSDFLRYLLLAAEGGYYSDSDTVLKKPVNEWVPESLKDKTKAIIGIEYDALSEDLPKNKKYHVSFAQYTLAAAPGHPIMMTMVDHVVSGLKALASKHGISLSEITPKNLKDREILETTGPRGFSTIMYTALTSAAGEQITWRNLTGLKEPKLVGDILILPINGFGAGQAHSGSDGNSPDQLVRHIFKGSWRNWNGR